MHPYSFTPDHPELKNWIIYQDDYLIALNKPSGLLSVPGRVHKFSLINHIQESYPTALTVHRLDMETSGLILVALDKGTQKLLGQLFENRKIDKTYEAICQGHPPTDTTQGSIDLPIRCDWENRPKQIIDFEQGKSALTHWKVLEAYSDSFRIELTPITGRSHQLRVHMQAMGNPIIGDQLYQDPPTPTRLQLHATWLKFIHPLTQEVLELHSPAPF